MVAKFRAELNIIFNVLNILLALQRHQINISSKI